MTAADRPPLRRHYAGELLSVFDLALGRMTARRIGRRSGGGGGRGVLVVPGFLAGDGTMALLRAALDAAGYRAFGWEMGQNRGVAPDTLDRLSARLDAIVGERVALVGWSLGGLFARELAKRAPERIERVVTLGTPFSGDPRANHAWRIYERVAGHAVDAPPIRVTIAEKPPVPTIALWSRRDGIVSAASSRGLPHEADVAIEVDVRHMGFPFAPRAIAAVLDALALPVRPAPPPRGATSPMTPAGRWDRTDARSRE